MTGNAIILCTMNAEHTAGSGIAKIDINVHVAIANTKRTHANIIRIGIAV